jgi:signal transduction histidine kinase
LNSKIPRLLRDVRTRRDGEFFLVEIADNGSGIPPEARPHIFAVPIFTTKGGSGTRLGLETLKRTGARRHFDKLISTRLLTKNGDGLYTRAV